MSRHDRPTIPEDLSPIARESERKFSATDSDVRSAVSLFAVPWLVVTYPDLQKLPLDARAGFVVSLIDGRCTVEMILDVSGMPEDEALDILRELVRLGAVELRDPGASDRERATEVER
jgi:hypothetical protein